MSDVPELPVIPCPMCGAAIAAGATVCTECGEWRPEVAVKSDDAPRPARAGDIVSAVVMALIAFGITLPINIVLTRSVGSSGPDILAIGLVAGTWNLVVWGIPIVATSYWWYRGAKRGDSDKSYLWRIYWRSQMVTLGSIIAVIILLLTICAASM